MLKRVSDQEIPQSHTAYQTRVPRVTEHHHKTLEDNEVSF